MIIWNKWFTSQKNVTVIPCGHQRHGEIPKILVRLEISAQSEKAISKKLGRTRDYKAS